MATHKQYIHNKNAPYWATTMVILGVTGLATIWIDLGDFWKGYVLDMVGPAWNYILFRGLFTGYKETRWTRFFTSSRTLVIFLIVCFGIEGAQYLEWYDATFDPFDFLAYVSLLLPLYIIDVLSGVGRQASGIRHQASGIRYQTSSIKRL